MRHELNTIIGNQNEELALEFLEAEGFFVLERNYYARKLGEIDIIALQDNVLHFIEVNQDKQILTLFITLHHLNREK